MSSYDEMTKDELLEEAKARGITPANAAMSKAELRDALESEGDQPQVGETVTTTKTKDFINRPLVNATPGTSAATDYLGRSVVASDKDFLGRALVA